MGTDADKKSDNVVAIKYVTQSLDALKAFLVQNMEAGQEIKEKYGIPGWEIPESVKSIILDQEPLTKEQVDQLLEGLDAVIATQSKNNQIVDRVTYILSILKTALPFIMTAV